MSKTRSRIIELVIVLVAIIVVAICINVCADSSNNVSMKGQIVCPEDKSPSQYKVTIFKDRMKTSMDSVIVNQDGSYKFSNLPEGKYSIFIHQYKGSPQSGMVFIDDPNATIIVSEDEIAQVPDIHVE